MKNATAIQNSEETSGRTATRASKVYTELRRDIVHGRIAPGNKLRIEELVDRYNVGATPLREALNRLSVEGLVSQQDQRGFRVSTISKEALLELTQTREWVAEITLRESITHGDAAWEEGIVLAFHRLSRAPNCTEDDPHILNPLWEERHREFHHALIAACPSSLLLEFSDRLFDAADRYRNLVTERESSNRDVLHEHRDIMDATVSRRTGDAVQLLIHHIRSTTDALLNILGHEHVAPLDQTVPEGRGERQGK